MAAVISLLGLVCFAVPLWMKGRHQQARVAPLLGFDASIEAQYAPYEYEPPPSTTGTYPGGTITLILGRGQRIHGFSVRDEPPPHLAWVASVFNEHCFAPVTRITISDAEFSDADVDLLLGFPELREIDLSYTAISDAGLIKLAALDRLTLLNVSGTSVSAESLQTLKRCRELRELDVSDTAADEELIESLRHALPDCWIR